ncbi:TIGR02302 family protein [Paralimibaculum aggregatum]|uniref:TIGR02302 family protein n=1 Tax=Paralimibaculum aggregatum TaxID=3036245 RepID=A0ABQ6LHR7_9RHOB|nr:TIGR02302 family protein [Limibaculum sp. NKW23]GMG82834.1 TIGR02302 family protein [Limibaculum sp. NKW23]
MTGSPSTRNHPSAHPHSVFDRPRSLAKRLRRAIDLSEAALWVEALAGALWPAFALLCALAAAAVLGALEGLGAAGHWTALGLAGAALLAALAWGFRDFRLPRRAAAMRRLDASRPERPLAVITDRMAAAPGQDGFARALWHEHQRRAEAAAAEMRASAPDLRLARRDRWALRLATPVLLVAALIGAGDLGPERLAALFEPGRAGEGAAPGYLAEPAIEAWAVPPAYTGEETVYLNRRADAGTLSLPQGTEITIRATGMETAPALDAAPLDGAAAGFTALGGGLHEASGVLARSGSLTVGDPAAPMGAWRLDMVPDAAPEIGFSDDPRPGAARSLEVPFAASDDHGITAAWAVIALADPAPAEQRAEIPPIEFGLPLPISRDTRNVVDVAVQDLTEHPWAGAEVTITLHAEDGAGQVGSAGPRRIRLPERRFTDPLARALAEQRRELLLDYGAAERVLDTVQAVTRFPGEVFKTHTGAYLGVRLALRRLAPTIPEDRVASVAGDVAEFLWRAALSLEAGDLASALERLREAEERLRSALESGTDEEIREAMEELRQAINDYLEEMIRQALQNPESLQQMPQGNQQLSRQDLDELLDQLQRQAESGLRDQARDMLSQLSQMLQNLQMGQGQGQSPGQQALEQLQDLIRRQQQLSDETFDALRQQRRESQQGQRGQRGQQGQSGQQGQGRQPGQQGRPGGEGGEGMRAGRHGENGRLAAEQEALRRALEELAGQLGGGEGMDGASRSLGQAGDAMGRARDDLDQGATGPAVEDQMEALDSLNGAAEALAESIEQGQGQAAASGFGEADGPERDAMDPFDRPAGNNSGNMNGRLRGGVPDQALIDRARELLQELRRRAGERDRPDIELRYFERLLEQF